MNILKLGKITTELSQVNLFSKPQQVSPAFGINGKLFVNIVEIVLTVTLMFNFGSYFSALFTILVSSPVEINCTAMITRSPI